MRSSLTICTAAMLALLGATAAWSFELNGITFNDDYGPDRGYVAYIQPYDPENQFHSLPDQQIKQYGNPGDAPLGPWSEGQSFNFEYGKAFGFGEAKAWAGQNYVVTCWWDATVGDYVPANGAGGDIYIYQPDDGVRCLGILYQGQWRMFDAGTNGLSDVRGDDYWWDLSDAGVAEGDTIDGLAWWANALGFPGLLIEKKFPDGHKEQYAGPSTLDMDGDGVEEPLTFPAGGTAFGYHDAFYMGIGNASVVLPPSEVWVATTGDDSNPGTQAEPFATIQKGIDTVADGGTVHVAAGTYPENLAIPAGKDNLELLGESRDTTVITPASGTAITLSAPATVKGFHILQTDSSTAIKIPKSTASATGGNPALVEDCTIESPASARGNGVDFSDYEINYWNIKDNIFINRKLTIYLNQASHMVISGNTVTGWKEGIGMNWDGAGAHDLTITNNTFGATDYPFAAGEDQQKAAIMLGMPSYDVTISGNTFVDNPNGIRVPFDADAVEDLSNVHVSLNNFSNTTYYAILNEAASDLDAANNYWGSGDGPEDTVSGSVEMPAGGDATPVADMLNAVAEVTGTLGALVSDNVDYYPWAEAEIYSGTSDVAVDDDWAGKTPGELVVYGGKSYIFGTNAFATIQAGVDAVTDSIVYVAAGTYVEVGQIVIDKDVTVIGDASDKPIIKPAQDTGGSGDARGWWLVQAGANLDLSNVVLDGVGHEVHQCLRVRGTGTVVDCDIRNITYSTYYGLGVVFMGGNGTASDNSFVNIGRIGAMAFGSGVSNAVFSRNTYTGKGDIDCLDYGVEIGGGAVATITGNTITNCRGVASSDGSTSAGVLVTTYYGAGSAATLSCNTITGNTGGIAVGYDASDTSVVVAHNNNLFANDDYGIDTTAPFVDAENNWWGSPNGPDDPSGSLEMPENSGATVAEMLNAQPAGYLGDAVSDDVDYYPWLGGPASDNSLWLNVTDDSLYVTTSETVTVHLDVRNLQQSVNGLQAVIAYDAAMLAYAGIQDGQTAVGGDWDLVFAVADMGGVVYFGAGCEAAGTTQADATVAAITFTPLAEGTTQLTFTEYGGEASILTGVSGDKVFAVDPVTFDSQTITIDDTPPTFTIVVAVDPPSWTNQDTVEVTWAAQDASSGLKQCDLYVNDVLEKADASSPYTLDVTGLTDCASNVVKVVAIDHAGNSADSSADIYLDNTPPVFTAATAVDPPSWTNQDTVEVTWLADGACSGIKQYDLYVNDVLEQADASSPYTLDVTGLTDCASNVVKVVAIDNAANSADSSADIYLDNTPPVFTTATALDPPSWTNQNSVEVTWLADGACSGIKQCDVYVDSILDKADAGSPCTLDVSSMADGQHTVTVRAIDNAGNSSDSSATLYLDKTPPVISIDSATQNAGATDLLAGEVAVQGLVSIGVSASDATSGLAADPDVTLTFSDSTGSGSLTGSLAAGYTYTITAATPNGTTTITATVFDQGGNSSTDTATFTINKNQIDVTLVELEGLNPQSGGLTRTVTFKATDAGGIVLETWDEHVFFDKAQSTGTCVLQDVPQATAAISAKTAWNLRRKLGVTLDGDGQASADFSGPSKLLGGDVNGTNSINILDYAWLRINWHQLGTDNRADINGDGQVQTGDYIILVGNWFKRGDAE